MGGFGTVYEAKPLPPRGENHHSGHRAFLRTPCLDQAGGRRRLWPFSHNRGRGLVVTDPSRREPTGRVMTADPRSACGRNPRSEARSDATAPGPMLTQERPARSGPAARTGPARRRPARRPRRRPAWLGLARLGGHDPETPPESTTRVGSTARRARSGSTGPVRRAHEAWHRGYRWDLFRWDWSGSASPMP